MSGEITNEILMVELKNLDTNNSKEHNALREQSNKINDSIGKILESHEKRIRNIEDWKLQFVAKFSVYASIALFLGTLCSQLLIKYFDRFIN
jgi:hypothetical protein